jgi:hypothetical protein
MSSLPPAMNFAETEEEICKKWKEDDAFHLQNKLSKERGDEVSTPSADCLFFFTSLLINISIARRNSPFMTVLHLPLDCRTTVTFWLVPLKIPSLDMRP